MKRHVGMVVGALGALAAGACAAPSQPGAARPCPPVGPVVSNEAQEAAGPVASATADASGMQGARPERRGGCAVPAAAPAPSAGVSSAVPPGSGSSSSEPTFGPMKDFPDLFEFREQFVGGRCGEFAIESQLVGSSPAVRVKRADGTLLIQLLPQIGIDSYFPSVCGDLNGDGIMELIVVYSTGGAHCCHTDIVLTLEAKPRVLLAMDMGDGGYAGPVKLLPGKRYQLVASDMVLAGADMAVPYAGVPSLPMILDWDGKAFVKATKKFPAFLRKRRAETLKEEACEPGDDICQDWRGTYIGAMSRLIGDWPQQRAMLPPKAQRAGDKVIGLLDAVRH